MLEISPWPGATNGGSPASGDTGSGKDLQILTSENSNMSNHGFNSSHIDVTENDFCTADLLLGDNSAAAHDTLFNYHIPQTENNLSFLNNECNDKECNDLFYGWSDIGNFEDVDKMLRSCDSPFGLESIDNEDMCWFPSQPTEESEAATTDYSKLNQMLESHGASVLKNEDSVTNSESNHMVKDDPQSVVDSESVLEKVSADASDTSSLKKDTSMLDEQTNLNKKLTKERHHLDGKRNRCSDNGRMLRQNDYFRQIIDTEHEYGTSTCECYAPSNEPYSSNNAQSLDSLHGPPVDTLGMIAFDKRTNLHQGRDTHPSFAANGRNGNKNMMVFSESVHVQKIGQENEDINDATKSELSNVQESYFVRSVMDDISLEATSYRQLQQVIEQISTTVEKGHALGSNLQNIICIRGWVLCFLCLPFLHGQEGCLKGLFLWNSDASPEVGYEDKIMHKRQPLSIGKECRA